MKQKFHISLYLNDLPESCPGADLQMYADDTVIYIYGKTAIAVVDQLSEHLEAIARRLENLCLTLNVKKKPKTVSICFSPGGWPTSIEQDVKINSQSIN